MTTGTLLTTRKFWMALAVCFTPCLARIWAQTPAPQAAQPGGNVEFPHYKDTPNGRVLDALFTGQDAVNLPGGGVQVKDFKMLGLRDGQVSNVTVTALAPECRMDYNRKIAWDPGPVQIFTPNTNLFVQGLGFFCAESNQLLTISNQVETRVLKSMLRSSPLFAAQSNAAAGQSQIIKILAERGQFDFLSNRVDYSGRVRLIDPQYEMDSPLLSIQFTSNRTVETMFARPDVALTLAGRGVATGATAHYFATNENALLELAGDDAAQAQWHNGQQEASAAKFTYDPNRHLLTGDDQVRVRWPNPPPGPSATNTFRQLLADHAALQLTTNGGDVEGMTAAGNVLITNQADQSSAAAGQAAYDRPGDLFTLTENPVWRNDRMEVRGDTLSMQSSNKVYHAQGHARLQLRVSGAAGGPAGSTNQWLHVSAADIVSQPVNPQTNLVTFRGDVQARLLDGATLQDTLTAQVLLVYQSSGSQALSNQVVLVVARQERPRGHRPGRRRRHQNHFLRPAHRAPLPGDRPVAEHRRGGGCRAGVLRLRQRGGFQQIDRRHRHRPFFLRHQSARKCRGGGRGGFHPGRPWQPHPCHRRAGRLCRGAGRTSRTDGPSLGANRPGRLQRSRPPEV